MHTQNASTSHSVSVNLPNLTKSQLRNHVAYFFLFRLHTQSFLRIKELQILIDFGRVSTSGIYSRRHIYFLEQNIHFRLRMFYSFVIHFRTRLALYLMLLSYIMSYIWHIHTTITATDHHPIMPNAIQSIEHRKKYHKRTIKSVGRCGKQVAFHFICSVVWQRWIPYSVPQSSCDR